MSSTLRRLRAIACATSLLASLTGCGSLTGISGRTDPVVESKDATRVACRAFGPFYWSPKDTDGTIGQAKQHNAAYDATCGQAPAAPPAAPPAPAS